MKTLLLKNISVYTLLAILMFSTTAAFADCYDPIESGCDGGWAWLGLRHDDANVAQGQTVTLPCDAEIVSVEFQILVSTFPNNGVPSMVSGDEIHVAMIDSDSNILTSSTVTVPDELFNGWVDFQFPEGWVVPAGQYLFLAYSNAPGWASFGFCYQEDTYVGGSRIATMNGIDGPFPAFGEGFDAAFRLNLDTGSVANQKETWGSVKGMYR